MTYSSASEREHRLSSSPDSQTFAFLDFALHVATAELRQAGAPVALSAQSFALLLHLLRNHARVVSREELIAQLWPGVAVGEGSLRQAIWEVRQALGDTAGEPRLIKTIRGRGYRFVAELSAQAAAPSSAPELPRPKSFYGRDRELALLESTLRESQRGPGRACLIAGAPGVGKSRLAQELARGARATALPVYEAHADANGAAPPLWPWLSLLTQLLARSSAPERAAHAKLSPLVFKLLEGAPAASSRIEGLELSDDTPTQQRFQLIDELGRLFGALLGDPPCLLLLEDAQWTDETSLAFLGHIASVLPRTRALLVVTSRTLPKKQNRALARAVEALARGAFSERLELDNLTPDDILGMLTAHTGGGVTPALAADVHALSQGNPLFALELARLLARSAPEQRSSCLHERIEVHTVIRRHLQALPESALDAVCAASVLGRDFSLAELAGVLGEAPQATLARLDTCRESGVLLEHARPGSYRFSHPLVRDAAYASLTPSRRVALHLTAGEWLERRAERAGPGCAAELAHHFFLAAPLGAAAKAVRYAALCAEHAYQATGYAGAVAHYDRALACSELSDFDPGQRLELELARGEALRASGEPATRVNQLFLEIAQRAGALGQAELFARAALGYAGQRAARFTPTRFVTTVSTEELDLLERALRGLGDTHDELRILLLCALVFALLYSLDRPRRERLAAEGLALARRHGDAALIARTLELQIYACAAPDAHEHRLAACHELLAVARAARLKEAQVIGHVSRALCLLASGDARGARQDEAHAQLLAEELGVPRLIVRSRLLALLRAFSAGDMAEAERLSNQALEVAKDDVSEQMLHMVRMSALRLLRAGDVQEMAALNEAMLASYPDSLPCRCALASAYAAAGQRETAHRHFDWVARDDFAHVPEDIVWLSAMLSLADAAVELNDAARAQLIYDKLAAYGDVFALYAGGAVPAGPVAYTLGMLATTLGDYEQAARWLARAQAINQQLEAHLFTHVTAMAEARLIYRARPWEAARARGLLEEACGFAEQRGIRWLGYYADDVRREAPRGEAEARVGASRLREVH